MEPTVITLHRRICFHACASLQMTAGLIRSNSRPQTPVAAFTRSPCAIDEGESNMNRSGLALASADHRHYAPADFSDTHHPRVSVRDEPEGSGSARPGKKHRRME
jgi:hypothetical protein